MAILTQDDTKEITKQDFWKKHYASYKESGLSKAAYSRKNDISNPQFIYWSHKFELEMLEKPTAILSPANFAKVEIGEDKIEMPVNKIIPLCTLELGGSKRLIIQDMTVTKMLLNALGVI